MTTVLSVHRVTPAQRRGRCQIPSWARGNVLAAPLAAPQHVPCFWRPKSAFKVWGLGCWMFGPVGTWCCGSLAAFGGVGCHLLLSDTFTVWAEGRQVNTAVQALSYETASCCLDSSYPVVVWPALRRGEQDSLVLSVRVSWDAPLVVQ